MLTVRFVFIFIVTLLASANCYSNNLTIAVASNFSIVMHELSQVYRDKTGQSIRISSASTGKLYAQIKNGAPYDIFFSADAERADLLAYEGLGVTESLRVYAIGKLVFLSRFSESSVCIESVKSSRVKKIAIANPGTAPYGIAAKQALEKLGYWQVSQGKLVRGENISQTFQYFDTGNAQAGIIAKSQLVDYVLPSQVCVWEIPTEYYQPIEQKMLVLNRANASIQIKDQIKEFISFLESQEAISIIKKYGYQI